MSTGNSHIPRPGSDRNYCGAPVRKSTQNRPQPCPQCVRVRKREGGKTS